VGGKEKATELPSGIVAMGARVYDPYTGTFTQPDPIQGGGANAYGYTDGDPVNETDLSGDMAGPHPACMAQGRDTCPSISALPSLNTLLTIGAFIPIPGLEEVDDAALAERVASRASELQSSLSEAQSGRVTMAVGVGRDEAGNLRTVVGTSEKGGYLRPGVTLKPGEELATGSGHAEANVVQHMNENSISPSYVAAGRPICGACAASITRSGGATAGRVRP
jgi:filamentous hemagglutinin